MQLCNFLMYLIYILRTFIWALKIVYSKADIDALLSDLKCDSVIYIVQQGAELSPWKESRCELSRAKVYSQEKAVRGGECLFVTMSKGVVTT